MVLFSGVRVRVCTCVMKIIHIQLPSAPLPPIPSYLEDVLQMSCEDNRLVKGFKLYSGSFAREAEQNWFKGLEAHALQILGK